MAYRRTPFAPGEWYHCYSRGVDKRKVFETRQDYERFLQALYLSNDKEPTQRSNFQKHPHEAILAQLRNEPLVAVGAYCLMSNHFHLLLQETVGGGITKFMHKLGTSYTMYFNNKRGRVGNLFVKPFRSKHVGDERYLKRIVQYIHLNPIELFERGWKQGRVESVRVLKERLQTYRYSSLFDYGTQERAEKNILDREAVSFLKEDSSISEKLLAEAAAYYMELRY